MRITLILAALFLAIPACSSDPEMSDEGQEPGDGDEGSPDAGPASGFAALYDGILAPRCAGCHGEADPAGGLSLSSAERAHSDLIDVASGTMDCGGRVRVVPGDAERSLLLAKVTGTDLCGLLMPIGAAPLSEDEIASIRDWIDGGALP